jgi:hypothetical protein
MIDAATLVSHVKDDIERSTTTLTRLLLLRSIITIRVFDRARDLARARDLEGFRAQIMGNALAHALTRALPRYTMTSNWLAEFSQKSADETGIAKASYVVTPDTLADKVQNGEQDPVNLLAPLNGAASLPWAHQATINLRESRCRYLLGNNLLPRTPPQPYGSRRSAWPPKPTLARRTNSATPFARSRPE